MNHQTTFQLGALGAQAELISFDTADQSFRFELFEQGPTQAIIGIIAVAELVGHFFRPKAPPAIVAKQLQDFFPDFARAIGF
jgi:hypothetical protein